MEARKFLDNLKKEYNVLYDKELAEILKTSKEALDKWVVLNKIPDKIINRIGQKVTGDNNISIYGNNNKIKNFTDKFDDDIIEICQLLHEYGTPKIKQELKDKLLQIKALHG